MDIKQITFSVCLLGATCLHVAEADQNHDSGVYLSVGIGQNRIQSGIPKGTTTLLKAAVGWQFSPFVGVELSYNDFGQFPGPTPAFTDFDMTGVSAAVIGTLPVSERLALYAKAGQVWWSTDSSFFFFGRNAGVNESGTLSFSEADVLLGVGASYELSDQLELELEYNYHEFNFSDYSAFNNTSSALLLSLKLDL